MRLPAAVPTWLAGVRRRSLSHHVVIGRRRNNLIIRQRAGEALAVAGGVKLEG